MLRRLAKRVMSKVTGARPSPPPPPSDPPAAPAAAESLATIEADAQEVKERIDAGEPVLLLDVRNPAETTQGVIEGAVLIPLPLLAERWEELTDANEIVCYCASGIRSLQSARFLREKGLFNATSLSGGVGAWAGAGGALVSPDGR